LRTEKAKESPSPKHLRRVNSVRLSKKGKKKEVKSRDAKSDKRKGDSEDIKETGSSGKKKAVVSLDTI